MKWTVYWALKSNYYYNNWSIFDFGWFETKINICCYCIQFWWASQSNPFTVNPCNYYYPTHCETQRSQCWTRLSICTLIFVQFGKSAAVSAYRTIWYSLLSSSQLNLKATVRMVNLTNIPLYEHVLTMVLSPDRMKLVHLTLKITFYWQAFLGR